MSIAHTNTIGARGGTVQENARRTVRPAEAAIEKSTSAVIQNEQKIQMTTGKDADIVPRRNAHIADITTVMTATHTVIRKSPRGDIGAIHNLDLAHPTDVRRRARKHLYPLNKMHTRQRFHTVTAKPLRLRRRNPILAIQVA
jgi:hypothetical protein